MTIIALEALTFGLNRLAHAAQEKNETLCLLTRDRFAYDYELAQNSRGTIKIIDVDTFDIEKTKAAIHTIADARGLLSTTDTWSLIYLDVAQACGFSCQVADSVRLLRDKFLLRQHLFAHGLSAGNSLSITPQTANMSAIRDSITYPAIVKDSAGTASQHVWLAEDEAVLKQILVEASTIALRGQCLTIEPYFIGTLYSAEVLSWEGENRLLAISSRILSSEPMFREEALSAPIHFPHPEMQRLEQWLYRVLDSVAYRRGFSHIEFIVTSDGFEIVEINPRLGGVQIGEALCQIYGTNIYEALIEMALGKRPALLDTPLIAQHGVAMAFVYAKQTGNFQHITGLNRIANHPGNPVLYPTAMPGKVINNLNDQRACVGILVACGATSEIAMQNVLSAQNKIHVTMAQNHQYQTSCKAH